MSLRNMLNTNNAELPNGVTEVEFIDRLIQAIEKKRSLINDPCRSSYSRLDYEKLRISIEMAKLRFAQRQITAKQLSRDVTAEIGRFKIKHHDFDYVDETVHKAFFHDGHRR